MYWYGFIWITLCAGLENIKKTCFATLVWATVCHQHCLPAICKCCASGQINTQCVFFSHSHLFDVLILLLLKKYNNIFTTDLEYLNSQLTLTQCIVVGEVVAQFIEHLKAVITTPADVYLYWLVKVACTKQMLETCKLPDHAYGENCCIINARRCEFFCQWVYQCVFFSLLLEP